MHAHTVVNVLILILQCDSFQELECAVSVEEDNRQEWTFTLYDFDNNGKVTREVMVQTHFIFKHTLTHNRALSFFLPAHDLFLFQTNTHMHIHRLS